MTSDKYAEPEKIKAICVECGDIMLNYRREEGEEQLCAGCAFEQPPPSGSHGFCSCHWEDDESGASSSWDNAVKRYEASY